uniref:Uncharacterized protein n=1 Tax=Eutreptiella gymnastica TaxID=73025 RepID=A0A7S4CXH5_9EUGL
MLFKSFLYPFTLTTHSMNVVQSQKCALQVMHLLVAALFQKSSWFSRVLSTITVVSEVAMPTEIHFLHVSKSWNRLHINLLEMWFTKTMQLFFPGVRCKKLLWN